MRKIFAWVTLLLVIGVFAISQQAPIGWTIPPASGSGGGGSAGPGSAPATTLTVTAGAATQSLTCSVNTDIATITVLTTITLVTPPTCPPASSPMSGPFWFKIINSGPLTTTQLAWTGVGQTGCPTTINSTLNNDVTWIQMSYDGTGYQCTIASSSTAAGLNIGDVPTVGAHGVPVALALTTTGSSGAATLSGGILNIPQYSGGGNSPFSPLVYANWTTGVGVGCTPTQVQSTLGNAFLIVSGTGSTNTCGVTIPVPNSGWTHKVLIYPSTPLGNFNTVAVGFYDGTKLEYCGSASQSTASSAIQSLKETDLTGTAISSSNGTLATSLIATGIGPLTFTLTRTGTTLTCTNGVDGTTYPLTVFSDTVPFLTPTAIFVGVDARGSSVASSVILAGFN